MEKTSPKTAKELISNEFFAVFENGKQVGSLKFNGQFWLFYHIGASQARYRAGSRKQMFEDLNIVLEDELGGVEYSDWTIAQIKEAIIEAISQNDIQDILHYTLVLENKINAK